MGKKRKISPLIINLERKEKKICKRRQDHRSRSGICNAGGGGVLFEIFILQCVSIVCVQWYGQNVTRNMLIFFGSSSNDLVYLPVKTHSFFCVVHLLSKSAMNTMPTASIHLKNKIIIIIINIIGNKKKYDQIDTR